MSISQLPQRGMKPQSFWERKEGMTGLFLLAFATYGGGWAAYKFFPLLAKVLFVVMKSLWLSAFSVASIAILVMVISSPKFWKLVSYGFKSVSRWITGLFVAVDPIGIMKNYSEDLKDNLANLAKQVKNLYGQMTGLKEVIEINANERTNAIKVAKQARENNKGTAYALQARRAGRLLESNRRLEDVYMVMTVLYKALTKYHEVCDALIQDIDSEIDVKTRERNAVTAAWGAIRSAKAIMYGQATGRELFDQATEYMAQDYATKKGEIDQFLDMSRGFIETFDLQTGMYEADALEAIEDWSKKGDSLLLGDQSQLLLEDLSDSTLDTDNDRKTIDYIGVLSSRK